MNDLDRLLSEEVERVRASIDTPWLAPAELASTTRDYRAIGKHGARHLNADDFDPPVIHMTRTQIAVTLLGGPVLFLSLMLILILDLLTVFE